MGTNTTAFGVSKRESHDASAFYGRRLMTVVEDPADVVRTSKRVNRIFEHSATYMPEIEDNSVALMVTSPPYHVGKEYDSDSSFEEYLTLLECIFEETYRKLEPGGRAVVNVANLGRKPYVPLSHMVTERMLKIGYLMRAEIIWQKAKGANGSCAWGSWRSPKNPVVRDIHEYLLCFSKGRFDRVRTGSPTIDGDDFMAATLSVWNMAPESANRVNHPAPFPVELPRRFIEMYTYEGDLVLDPFIGSGTTGVAARGAGRNWVGYEIDKKYARQAMKRISESPGPNSSSSEE